LIKVFAPRCIAVHIATIADVLKSFPEFSSVSPLVEGKSAILLFLFGRVFGITHQGQSRTVAIGTQVPSGEELGELVQRSRAKVKT